jgi:phosphoribosyl 1,2-cyclic phosphodiesterase
MLKFISFGSGSSGNCYYLFTERDGLIIDSGIGIRALKKGFHDHGLQITDVKHVLVTHDHADHVKSVGVVSNDFNLPVYTTHAVHVGIDRNYCVARKISPENAQVFEKGTTFTLGDFTVTSFDVPHDSSDCMGYCIEAGGVTFCLITDAGQITDEIKPFISRANYLVIEANHDEEMLQSGPYPQYLKDRITGGNGHLNNKLCGEAIAQNMKETLQHVWLCHLSEENNHPELARKTVESILRSYGIIIGKTLQLDVLKRTMPTGVFEL